LVTVREYIPAIAAVALVDTTGLCSPELNPLGPLHVYANIPPGPPVRLNCAPGQTGPLFEAVADGAGLTIFVIPADVALQPFELVTITSTTCPLVKVFVIKVGDAPFCILPLFILKS
jgi:hypothetical protein